MEQHSIAPAEPSDHRKLMLRIAKLLSREDVDDIYSIYQRTEVSVELPRWQKNGR